MKRFTFVLHVYPGAESMLENVSTHERVRVSELTALGPQIERWLASLTALDADERTRGEIR